MPKELAVDIDVNPQKESTTYGDTTIVVPKDDQDRTDFLNHCEAFFAVKGRDADANKFHQAIKHALPDRSDDEDV